jgi:hypothetical protein
MWALQERRRKHGRSISLIRCLGEGSDILYFLRKKADKREKKGYNRPVRRKPVNGGFPFLLILFTIPFGGFGYSMKKKYFYPLTALALGVLGMALRTWQMNTCFDQLGLPVPGAATTWLIALTAGAAILALPAAIFLKKETGRKEYNVPVRHPVLIGACVGYLLTAVFYALYLGSEEAPEAVFQMTNTLLPIFMMVGLLLSAAAMVNLSGRGKQDALSAIVPGFCSCFFLVNLYHLHANDPVVLDFAWELLALAASALGWYYAAGFGVKKVKPNQAVYFSLMTVVLSLIPLGDSSQPYVKIFLITQALFFTVESIALLNQMEIGFPDPAPKKGENPDKTAKSE